MPAAKTIPKRKSAKRDAQPEGVLDVVAALSAREAKRFLRLIARHPALSTGITAVGVIFITVSVNALFEQHGRHPNPMLVTRVLPAKVQQADADDVWTPPQRIAVQAPDKAAPVSVADEIAGAQRTRVPAPAPRPLERPDPEQTASIDTGGRVAKAASSAPAVPATAAEKRFAALSDAERVKKIQAALATAQVADLSVDGILGEQTKAAIRTFEALEGMTVTGNPNAQVLQRLAQIGLVP